MKDSAPGRLHSSESRSLSSRHRRLDRGVHGVGREVLCVWSVQRERRRLYFRSWRRAHHGQCLACAQALCDRRRYRSLSVSLAIDIARVERTFLVQRTFFLLFFFLCFVFSILLCWLQTGSRGGRSVPPIYVCQPVIFDFLSLLSSVLLKPTIVILDLFVSVVLPLFHSSPSLGTA